MEAQRAHLHPATARAILYIAVCEALRESIQFRGRGGAKLGRLKKVDKAAQVPVDSPISKRLLAPNSQPLTLSQPFGTRRGSSRGRSTGKSGTNS